MGKGVELVPKSIAHEPIRLPGNAFWNVLKRFGRDEAIAMLVNVGCTALASLLTANAFLLSFIGPVIEKIGFFPAHFREALGVYKTTPRKIRKSLLFYFRKAFHGGLTSLTEDILVHDPIYIALMFLGLKAYSDTPAWVLSFMSFLIALSIVAVLEVAYVEVRYWLFKRKMVWMGFGVERYYEARFFISKSQDPEQILGIFAKRFGLSVSKVLDYSDTYLETSLPEYSGRVPKLRLRERTNDRGRGTIRTAQITYTKAVELTNKSLEQYRYFPIMKEKIYFPLEQEMPMGVEGIEDKAVGRLLKGFLVKGFNVKRVSFRRRFANNRKIFISADEVHGGDPFYLLEVKAYSDAKALKEVMRYIMGEFPVVQTTHGKSDMEFR